MSLKLSEYRVSLTNLGVTFDALDKFDELIKFYSVDKPGPAYLKVDHGPIRADGGIQIDRDIMVVALKQQRDRLVEYLAKLGIEVDSH